MPRGGSKEAWARPTGPGILRPEGLLRFGLPGLIKSLREVPHVPVDAPHIRQGPVPLRGVPRTQVGGAHSKRPGAVNDAHAISARAIERRIAWTPRRYAKS